MVKKLKPTMFHRTMCILKTRENQVGKVVEELKELSEALLTKDRVLILEELADVEVTLPYLQLIYLSGETLEIKYTGSYDYHYASDTLIRLINLYSEYHGNANIYKALRHMAQHICECLYLIYSDYDITVEQVEEVKKMKKIRTIARNAREKLNV